MVDAVRPTKKQRQLLDFIEKFIEEHSYSPSYREIMNGLEYTSVATVALHVNNLIKRGHLIKRDHSARSIEVVKQDSKSSVAVDTGHENWLVKRVEDLIERGETDGVPVDGGLLLDALRALGLERQANELEAKNTLSPSV